ncbi:MAG TPA: tryptophan synthase subunit alpha, partial [Acidimicrobiales bacterium]|nr:tryptophan synthase subunit alpha [Acidimicrobiales bacterium]
MNALESALRDKRELGRKLLVPYVTGGLPLTTGVNQEGRGGGTWTQVIMELAHSGADAIEIGIPFSDPVMDGPIIQKASQLALDGGATPGNILEEIALLGNSADGEQFRQSGVPLAVMTYFNIAYSFGLERFAMELARCGVSGAILPDLPLEEASEWIQIAQGSSVDAVLLAAPSASDERLEHICRASSGFVYGVGVMGVTGIRDSLAASAQEIAVRLKSMTDKPVLIGVGVSDVDQARKACESADGVVIGSALMRR